MIAFQKTVTSKIIRAVRVVVKDIAIGAGGRGFDSYAGPKDTAANSSLSPRRFCVAWALSHEDGARQSLHTSA